LIRFLIVLIMFLLGGITVACGGKQGVLEIQQDLAEIEAEIGEIAEIDCPLRIPSGEEGETYACGISTVPMDYDNLQGGALNEAHMVLRATAADPVPDPIVFLAGGPGQSSIVSAGDGFYGDLRRSRDLILHAQRGTLFSHRLAIDELANLSNTRANYMPRMIAELETGDTTTFLALQNAEVGNDRPEGSLTSPAIDQLIQQISAAAATPDNPLAGLAVVAEITQAVQEENPREAMKAAAEENTEDAEGLPRVLESIDALSAEDLSILSELHASPAPEVDEDEATRRTEATAKNNALFMLSGIICAEQLAFSDVNAALNNKVSLAIPELGSSDAFLVTEVGNCTNYPMGDSDPTYHEPASTDVPILILQGEFDTRTPLQNGLVLADQLEDATLVVVPQAGHETWMTNSCAGEMGKSFISDPGQAPDPSCLAERQERFMLPTNPMMSEAE
jgi:pimeloyl-ACP methyl ester carboxylesterase